ncbi:cytochrome c biogenesis protein ResB [Cryobacterium sp. BB736]|uniref:cytochrome c biogenesis protein ResB n=1 Tax=Cryobacterium sp. BB736 TaxID=2746963 RepID=UPI001876AA10|nr:cytochrome c biogenesis protein ResB [Cryobacterium sp. BB736]
MSRPSDYVDAATPDTARRPEITQPGLGPLGYLRFFWRQLTSMRTALVLLLLLAIAAVPGSMWPQRSSDPNGVIQFFADNPDLAPVLDSFQLFDVYTSVWFSAIYLLLFVSLIGCVIPRTTHHLKALRASPPKTPARLERLPGFTSRIEPNLDAATAIDSARDLLRSSGYRVQLFNGKDLSASAERGYLRETGNLVFHSALVGILVAVGIGGGFSFSGQKVVIEGQPFVNVLAGYDSFNPGRFAGEHSLEPFRMTLDDFSVVYEEENLRAYGTPTDFTASVTTYLPGEEGQPGEVKVNHPLAVAGTNVYLLGNGYAPTITVRDGEGNIAFDSSVPFLPQDQNLTSLGVIKVPDALPEQLGMIGFFYPAAGELHSGALTSVHPDLVNPVLTLRVYTGDLGLDSGAPKSVYSLETDTLTEVVGGDSGVDTIELRPGESAELPNGLGTVTFESKDPDAGPNNWADSVPRFASFDIHHVPSQGWVLVFAILVLGGLLASLFVPRRRMWVKAVELPDGGIRIEYAGLARGEDPTLEDAVADIAERHARKLTT